MPPRAPHGPDGWEERSVSMLPFIGNFLFLLMILAPGAYRALSVAHRQVAAGESWQALAGGGRQADSR